MCTRRARWSEYEREVSGDMKQDGELLTDSMQLACTLTGAEQVTRQAEVNELFTHVQQVDELADGYALRFPGSDAWANALLQFTSFERRCCPFFTFVLVFEPEQGAIWLQLRGPDGVKAIIKDMIHQHEGGDR
jgi:hypothetical protein